MHLVLNLNDSLPMARKSISTSTSHAELNKAIGERIADMIWLDAPIDGAPLECAVYSSQKSQAFEAGDSSVYRLRTNYAVNRAKFLQAVSAWVATSALLPISSPDRDAVTAVSTYYDLERQFTVQAQVWEDNADLSKILNFGNQEKAVLGMLTREDFTVKATGEAVTAWRLNRCIFQGVDSQKGSKIATNDLAFLGLPASAPATPAPKMKINPATQQPTLVSDLLNAGWPQATIDALADA